MHHLIFVNPFAILELGVKASKLAYKTEDDLQSKSFIGRHFSF